MDEEKPPFEIPQIWKNSGRLPFRANWSAGSANYDTECKKSDHSVPRFRDRRLFYRIPVRVVPTLHVSDNKPFPASFITSTQVAVASSEYRSTVMIEGYLERWPKVQHNWQIRQGRLLQQADFSDDRYNRGKAIPGFPYTMLTNMTTIDSYSVVMFRWKFLNAIHPIALLEPQMNANRAMPFCTCPTSFSRI